MANDLGEVNYPGDENVIKVRIFEPGIKIKLTYNRYKLWRYEVWETFGPSAAKRISYSNDSEAAREVLEKRAEKLIALGFTETTKPNRFML